MRFGRTIALVLILASNACSKGDSNPNPKQETNAPMSAIVIPIDGMSCDRCASRVRSTLTAIEGVGGADVSLEQKRVVVHFDPHRTSADALATAINGAGFKAGAPSEAPR